MCSDKKIIFPAHPLKDWSRNLIAQSIQFSMEDMDLIRERRQEPNRLGFGYQLAFVRLANRFRGLKPNRTKTYAKSQKTNSIHY